MTVEAIKALFGQLPPYNPSLMTGATALTPQEELVSNRMRIRAWSMVSSQASALRIAHSDLHCCQPSDAHMHSGNEIIGPLLLWFNHHACNSIILIYPVSNPCWILVETLCLGLHDLHEGSPD